MEDNEFEEVTIISHTDRPHRLYFETSMSEAEFEHARQKINFELLQKMSHYKLTRAKNIDPRLAPGLRELEKLKQDHFGEGEGQIHQGSRLFRITRLAGESGQYLLGARFSAIISNHQGSKVHFEINRGKYRHIALLDLFVWGPYICLLKNCGDLHFYDRNLEGLKAIFLHRWFKESARTTPRHIYLMSQDGELSKIDRHLNAVHLQSYTSIIDFFVCPKTETITTLNKKGWQLSRGNTQVCLPEKFGNKTAYHILKKMYSDHFLVVGRDSRYDELNQFRHHLFVLVNSNSLKQVTSFEFKPRLFCQYVENIRLLAPRQGISCFLVGMYQTLELFCEYRLKLYHLKTLEIKSDLQTHPLPHILQHHTGDLWLLLVCNKLTDLMSFRVVF